jgi:hypothetical protein
MNRHEGRCMTMRRGAKAAPYRARYVLGVL